MQELPCGSLARQAFQVGSITYSDILKVDNARAKTLR